MRLVALLIFALLLFADSDGNGKCWQREKIEELQHITSSKRHIENGTLFIDSSKDNSDFYYFTPDILSTFDLIVQSDANISLNVGTRCDDSAIYSGQNDAYHVILDHRVDETIYLHLFASHGIPTHYKMHLHVKAVDGPDVPVQKHSNFATSFECVEVNNTITCKR